MKCKTKTPTVNMQLARSKNNRRMVVGKCEVCGGKKSQFVSAGKAEELSGSGLLSNLLGIKIPILSDLPLIGDLLF